MTQRAMAELRKCQSTVPKRVHALRRSCIIRRAQLLAQTSARDRQNELLRQCKYDVVLHDFASSSLLRWPTNHWMAMERMRTLRVAWDNCFARKGQGEWARGCPNNSPRKQTFHSQSSTDGRKTCSPAISIAMSPASTLKPRRWSRPHCMKVLVSRSWRIWPAAYRAKEQRNKVGEYGY